MAEKVAKLGVNREKDFMYYVKEASVWRVQRKQPGLPKGRPEKVATGSFKMDTDFIYFVDRDGDVSRADRAVGGQKRKKAPAAKKASKAKASKAKASKAKTTKASTSRSKAGTKAASSKKTSARPKTKVATKSAAKSLKSRLAKKKTKK